MATLYPSVTNHSEREHQPQMVTGTIGDLEKQGVTFSLVRVTGMKTPDAWHNTGLTVTQDDKDGRSSLSLIEISPSLRHVICADRLS